MFTIEESLLVIIDVQGNLANQIFGRDQVFQNIKGLIQAAKILKIPILYTEQAPDKIGTTVPEIAQYLSGINPILKAHFSCWGERAFQDALRRLKRQQIIICGIETHVCVYQTVRDLLSQKYKVEVVVDAVASRTQENKTIALNKMQNLGARLTSLEMIVTELLQTSKHPHFRDILKLIK